MCGEMRFRLSPLHPTWRIDDDGRDPFALSGSCYTWNSPPLAGLYRLSLNSNCCWTWCMCVDKYILLGLGTLSRSMPRKKNVICALSFNRNFFCWEKSKTKRTFPFFCSGRRHYVCARYSCLHWKFVADKKWIPQLGDLWWKNKRASLTRVTHILGRWAGPIGRIVKDELIRRREIVMDDII
jgi:hypothetical protein